MYSHNLRLYYLVHNLLVILLVSATQIYSGEWQLSGDKEALVQIAKDMDKYNRLNWITNSAQNDNENNNDAWSLVIWGAGENKDRVIAISRDKYSDWKTTLFGYSTAFESLTKLTRLEISNNEIDINNLAPLRQLVVLDLGFNNISDISCLKEHYNLQELSLAGNQLTDLSPLGNLHSLRRLNLAGNRIKDIQALGSLVNLEELNLADNIIEDISVLNYLPNLQKINLDKNEITRIPILTNLPAYALIYLRNNRITDLSGLESINDYSMVFLEGNKLRLSQVYEYMHRRKIGIGTQKDVAIPSFFPPLCVGRKYDIKTEYIIGGKITKIHVYDEDGIPATEQFDYVIDSDGMLEFLESGKYQVKMTNESVYSKVTIPERVIKGPAESITEYFYVK